jgi:DNA-binding response OmpR family regulator
MLNLVSMERVHKILIAEDEKPLARVLELKLTKSGFQTRVVLNGVEALRALKEEAFDLMLLDLIMPLKNGFEVLEEMRSENIHIPVIVVSNLGQEEDRKRVEELGAMQYVVKSNVSLAEIVKGIKCAFDPT